MAAEKEYSFYRWDSMKKERVSDMLERRLITGDRMMLAHVYLKKGCIVPKHSHENEQLTYILEGALKFRMGRWRWCRRAVAGSAARSRRSWQRRVPILSCARAERTR